MSIEEYEDSAVRGLLGTVFTDAEPPQRDLASGSIARGDAAHRRTRLAAGGAVLSVVAVVGAFAVVTGAVPARHGNPDPANKVTSAATSASPSGYLGFGQATPLAFDKTKDIQQHLPALLQPLLPKGISAAQMPPNGPMTAAPTTAGLLAGPGGTNQMALWVGSVPDESEVIRAAACPDGVTCHVRTIPGGTVYTYDRIGTAASTVEGAGLKADVLKAGTADTVVTKGFSLTYVPVDHSKYSINFTVSTKTAQVQYAVHAPSDYMTGGEWPPKLVEQVAATDPSGLLLSPDDVIAMLGKPGLSKVETLLDPRTAVSQDTKDRIAATVSQVVAAAAPGLPSSVMVSVDVGSLQPHPQLIVTGRSGKNVLEWQSYTQDAQIRQQWLGWCAPNVTCSTETVPGGQMRIWSERPMDSKGTVTSDTPSAYEYWLFPDDTSKPALTMTLSADASQIGVPNLALTAPHNGSSTASGTYAPAQVSVVEFLDAAQSGRLATAISQTASLFASF